MITVPSCQQCNRGTNKLDEEFKTQLSVMLGNKTPLTKEFWTRAATTRRKSRHLHRKIDEQISPILVRTPIGYQHPVGLNRDTIDTVVGKIVRGLHWSITKQVFSSDVLPEIFPLSNFESPPPNIMALLREFGHSIQKCGKQFEVIYAYTDGTSPSSIWLLRFYEHDCFWVALRPHLNDATNIGD
jgi:hypothetical protein